MGITIESPLNETYGLPVLVKFSAYTPPYYYLSGTQTSGWTGDFFYVLDGQNMSYSGIKIIDTKMVEDFSLKPYKNFHNFTGQTYVTELTPGMHNITIYWGYGRTNDIIYNPTWSKSSQFSVDSAPTSNFSSFALPLIAAGSLIAAITAASILVYFREQKKNRH